MAGKPLPRRTSSSVNSLILGTFPVSCIFAALCSQWLLDFWGAASLLSSVVELCWSFFSYVLPHYFSPDTKSLYFSPSGKSFVLCCKYPIACYLSTKYDATTTVREWHWATTLPLRLHKQYRNEVMISKNFIRIETKTDYTKRNIRIMINIRRRNVNPQVLILFVFLIIWTDVRPLLFAYRLISFAWCTIPYHEFAVFNRSLSTEGTRGFLSG